MMYRLLRMKPASFSRLIGATSKRSFCDDKSGKSKHNLEAKLLSLERDLEEIKSKFAMHGNDNACGDEKNIGLPLTKLALANGKYYIRSEAPWHGYLQGKFCSISDKTKSTENALFDVATDITDNGSPGFASFRSSLSDGSYLAVQKIEKDERNEITVEEKENFSGRLFLLKNDNKSSSLEAAQFELFVPINAENVAFFWQKAFWKKKEDGVRAIIRSVSNQRFLSIKSGGTPFATEKDPTLASVFSLESMNSSKVSKMALPSPGIYHIRVRQWAFKQMHYYGYVVEDEYSAGLLQSESLRNGIFRLSHNNDGTISLFSLTLNKYVCLNPSSYSSRIGFYDGGEIAKFELHKPEKPSKRWVKLLAATKCKFLAINSFSGGYLSDDESYTFEFLPARKGTPTVP